MSIFIDTNILVYSYDRLNKEKHKISVDLLTKLMEKNEIVVSTQVINEFIVVMTGKVTYPLSLEVVESHVKKFNQVFDIHPIQITDCIKALSIAKRYKFSYWDSLIVATAMNSGCSLLYSEDMQSGQTIEEKLTIMNPFSKKSKPKR